MPLGSSAGRSSRNRTADGAERRATPRQRDGIDPPGPLEPIPSSRRPLILTARGHHIVDLIGCGLWIGFWAGIADVLVRQFGF